LEENGFETIQKFQNCQFGWLRGSQNSLKGKIFLVAGGGFVPFSVFTGFLASEGKHSKLLIKVP
jgi:hypothetical protein